MQRSACFHSFVTGIMRLRCGLACLFSAVVLLPPAAQAQTPYPIMTRVANKVIDRYQTSTCEQLWANRGKPPGPEAQRLIGLLNNDPQMRQAFFDQISGPVVNKMFTCGMIP
jgi:hypothetical protein